MEQEIKSSLDRSTALICGLFKRVATLEAQAAQMAEAIVALSAGSTVVTDNTGVTQAPAVDMSAPVTQAPAAETPAATTAAPTELDDEGCPWDDRIHASTRSKVNSAEVKGGKKWRVKPGLEAAFVEQVKAEIKQPITQPAPTTDTQVPVADTPATTPAAPAPSVPGLPGQAPDAPVPGVPTGQPIVSEQHDAWKAEAIAAIKQLTDDYGLDMAACKEILVNEFGCAQNGDQVVFGSVPDDKYQAVRDRFVALRDKYAFIVTSTKRIYEIAGVDYKATVDQGVASLLHSGRASTVDELHYTQVERVAAGFDKWLGQWEDMVNNNGS